MPSIAPPTVRWHAWALLLLGATGFAAAWVLLALRFDNQLAWMALLGAFDLAVLQRLVNWPRGLHRGLTAVLTTAAVIVLANFLIAAGQIGQDFGLRPLESALRMGASYAWLLVSMANTRTDLLWYGASLVLALLSGLRSTATLPVGHGWPTTKQSRK
ncbi:MAG: hypothetical protein IT472_10575 [Thermomonas sp.]|uniref:hypothetical protein n=1 Tax=Thermomonas sp. TaxID=1971895 RepID=UPI002623E1C1|nr:hypothetical protein [Thermomonas sp.]MCC7097612.1 hypothetical protein [Thermomonas sp.]